MKSLTRSIWLRSTSITLAFGLASACTTYTPPEEGITTLRDLMQEQRNAARKNDGNRVKPENDSALSAAERRAEAVENYRAFIDLVEDGPEKRDATRRLADLLVERDREIPAELGDTQAASRSVFDQGPNDGRDNRDGPITLYRNLLEDNPDDPANDRVLLQLARALLAANQPEPAINRLEQLVEDYPDSRYRGEANLRRAELLFILQKYKAAEPAYRAVLDDKQATEHHEHSRYKLAWTRFKLRDWADAVDTLHPLLDAYLPPLPDEGLGESGIGVALDSLPKTKQTLIDDSLRVMTLSLSYADDELTLTNYLESREPLRYEAVLYAVLARYQFSKQRYTDAAATWRAFEERHPTHAQAPAFIEEEILTYDKGDFPLLGLKAREAYIERYQLTSSYWLGRKTEYWPQALDRLQDSIMVLAKHHHALAQNNSQAPSKRQEDFLAAAKWYGAFLENFPEDKTAVEVNYLQAEAYFDGRDYLAAAKAFEQTAYEYGSHSRAAEAGYGAVLAWRKRLDNSSNDADSTAQQAVVNDAVTAAIRFADNFKSHPETRRVLVRAAEDTYGLKDYERTIEIASRVATPNLPDNDPLAGSAWTFIANSEYELARFVEAEAAYRAASKYTLDPSKRAAIMERFALSIYRQGEAHREAEDLVAAAFDFRRAGDLAPRSKVAPSAYFDAAAALLELESWRAAIDSLTTFRSLYSGHELQQQVTEKLAYAYEQDGQLANAAKEYLSLAAVTSKAEERENYTLLAAQLYEQDEQPAAAAEAYKRYLGYGPSDKLAAFDIRKKLISLYTAAKDERATNFWRREIIQAERALGKDSSPSTRLVAAEASLALAELERTGYENIALRPPFAQTLKLKTALLKQTERRYQQAIDYGIAEIATQSTYRIAELYTHLATALLESPRPSGLSELELEEYELLLDEQAFGFSEKAISIHEDNIKRVFDDLVDDWVHSSLEQLADLAPANYAKQEQTDAVINSLR